MPTSPYYTEGKNPKLLLNCVNSTQTEKHLKSCLLMSSNLFFNLLNSPYFFYLCLWTSCGSVILPFIFFILVSLCLWSLALFHLGVFTSLSQDVLLFALFSDSAGFSLEMLLSHLLGILYIICLIFTKTCSHICVCVCLHEYVMTY